MKKNKTCVQCGEEMYVDAVFFSGDYYCNNPACPNYSLLAIPLEDMPSTEES